MEPKFKVGDRIRYKLNNSFAHEWQNVIVTKLDKYRIALEEQVNDLALQGWRLVNFHVAVDLSYKMHYAAMEKDL